MNKRWSITDWTDGKIYGLSNQNNEWYVLDVTDDEAVFSGISYCWFIPNDRTMPSICFQTEGDIRMISDGNEIVLEFSDEYVEKTFTTARPYCDIKGNQFLLDIENGEQLMKTLACFYWDTILPSVIEKTKGENYPDWNGYVVSTLEGKYAGTYPDVDHEFQCKGRLALSGDFELDVVRRMIELQFRMMEEDPVQLWRNPCAIQPDGTREYHVRRNSMDGTQNAEMFLVTGNIEVIESTWLYVARTKSFDWLESNIEKLEGAMSLIEHLMDTQGRLWSDVFYEDQVIKDGMEAMSASMAVNSFKLLADLEKKLNRLDKVEKYTKLAETLQATLIQEPPFGFWDEKNQRFIDWIDRNGEKHDHIHLLANILPVLFKQSNSQQSEAVDQLIHRYLSEFQRFPSFISAKIEDYRDDEIGDGGPYDLCAAGRYWCWDAAYWSDKGNGKMLLNQLSMVSEQAEIDDYIMGERYDMNHIYYLDDKNWHGAGHYYEYPNVFSWVLIQEYLGIKYDLNFDMILKPQLQSYGKVMLPTHEIGYEYQEGKLVVTNLGRTSKYVFIDLSVLTGYPKEVEIRIEANASEEIVWS